MFELNKLYNMDCMDAMREIPDNFFELAVCDHHMESIRSSRVGKLEK